ncbi:MAG TPA: alpha-amylase family glycosyl hydrolase [Bacillus sp. (in: firmicutes)]|nr:alpha-amylase family glycosyl hydrolase [Bacillus sp. (in: firmicutes)]
MKRNKFKLVSICMIFAMILQSFSGIIPISHAEQRVVTLVGNLQDELGASEEWNPSAPETIMTPIGNGFYQFSGELPAGTYEYKIAINGSWEENYGYGGRNGENLTFTLQEPTNITFHFHDGTKAIADSTWYQAIPQEKQPRIAGTIQPAIGAGNEWSPGTSTAILLDDNFDNIYTYKTTVPQGNYEYKIVLGSNWGQEYPNTNATLHVLAESEITFFYNNNTKEVYTDYSPEGSDNNVHWDNLFHDTWDETYRSPFGAVSTNTPVTLRLASKEGDLTGADLFIRNQNTGTSKVVSMTKAGTANGKDYWEAIFTPTQKGVYGYKFIAEDQTARAEYGEDTKEGHIGKTVAANADLFQLTVFDPSFKTPDWMKEAVVYQIFPDRFFNGNQENDTAKTNARGSEPIEHQEWNELPDNPDLSGSADYDGDGIWSNDFFGGDIAGIQQKLDYLQSLGVNTLYLNPIASAASNHKYDASDWKTIDPMFGTPEEFYAFTNELSKRGMHLILDGVFNHSGDDSIYFDRYGKYKTVGAYEYWSRIYDLMNEQGLPEEEAKVEARNQLEAEEQVFDDVLGYHNWFNIRNEKVDKGLLTERYAYQAWWGFDSLPEIKSIPGSAVNYDSELNNGQFADYIMYAEDSVAKSWIKNGGSGWRLDVANEVDMEFWREFRKQLKSSEFSGTGATLQEGEEPLILGEIWDDASKYFLGDQYDSVMNYRFRGAILDFLTNGNAENAAAQLTAVQEDYPAEAYYALMNLMGSHDTARAVFLLGGGSDATTIAEQDPNYNHQLGVQRLKLASIIQMGYPGAPTIYYGDEAGVTGSHDPDDRRTYPWGNEDQDLINHYRTIGEVRTKHSDLFAHGDMKTIYANGDVLAFARITSDKFGIIAINRSSSEKTIEIDVKELLKNGISLTDQIDLSYTVTSENGKVTLVLPAMSGRMLVSQAGQDLAFPEKVSHLSAEAGQGQVTLSWTGGTGSYKIYQSTLKGALYEEVGTTTDRTFTVSGLTNGQSYYFAVVSVDEEGNESEKTETTSAMVPHYEWIDTKYWIGGLTEIADQILDLSVSHTIRAEVWIEGATESGYAEGLTGILEVKKEGDPEWTSYRASYTGQSGNNNIFQSSFRPLESGTYTYRFAFTTDQGATWKYTNEVKIQFAPNPEDSIPPAEKVTLAQPLVESGQVNLTWSVSNPVEADAYLIAIERDGELLMILNDTEATGFIDRNVENGTTYTYKVTYYDRFGNKVSSNPITITPDIVMVEVTFVVHAPAYTPLDTKITIPSSENGWNTGAWEMSRNGAVTTDWTFTKEFPEGTEITYKYVKNGSWEGEGLPDHTPNDKTDDDTSYYGYGAIGTDLKITVTNQGNNKMIVNDEIFRWIDQPVVITTPENKATVDTDALTVKGNAIKGGILMINGEQVTVREDMSFAHVVKLQEGENTIVVSIEPSDEVKQTIFNNNSEAIAKSTKQYSFTVNYDAKSLITLDKKALNISEKQSKDGQKTYSIHLKNGLVKASIEGAEEIDWLIFPVGTANKEELVELNIHQEILQMLKEKNEEAILRIQLAEQYVDFGVNEFQLGNRKNNETLILTKENVTIIVKGNIED